MPSSNPETITTVIGVAWKLAPKKVLDVGTGYGKYGVLLREYLELRHRQDGHSGWQGALIRQNWQGRIDGVEGYRPYVGQVHRAVYDNVFVVNIIEFANEPWATEYDVIYMGDVLEHLEKSTGFGLLRKLVQRTRMGLLVSVPVNVRDQGPVFGNPLEVHHSSWGPNDFRSVAPFVHVGRKGGHLVAFLTENRASYKTVRGSVLRQKAHALKAALRDAW